MTGPENFLSRWSRLKADQKAEEAAVDPAPGPEAEAAQPQEEPGEKPDEKPEAEFDLSTLPPIESIGVGTDIRAFLQKGVPLDSTRAALRHVWTTDPAIRDFIEVAENQWDFATGSDLPGFGSLEMSDDVRRMVAEVFHGRPPEEEPGSNKVANKPPEAPPVEANTEDSSAPSKREGADEAVAAIGTPTETGAVIVHRKEEFAAPQQDDKVSVSAMPPKGRHGGALPQ